MTEIQTLVVYYKQFYLLLLVVVVVVVAAAAAAVKLKKTLLLVTCPMYGRPGLKYCALSGSKSTFALCCCTPTS